MKPEDAVINAIDELVDWQLKDSPAAVAERAAARTQGGIWTFSSRPSRFINPIQISNPENIEITVENATITFTGLDAVNLRHRRQSRTHDGD